MTLLYLSIPLIFLIINLISLIIFGIDKIKSIRGKWRISESRLLLIAFFAPFGAYVGMLLFRHKIRKVKFIFVPIFLFIQVYFILRFNLI